MTAPSIISHREAKEIALDQGGVGSPLRHFGETGEISQFLFRTARLLPGAVYRYIEHHGERGPVDGWEAI